MTLETQMQSVLSTQATILSGQAAMATTLGQVLTVVQGLPGGNNQQVLDAIAAVNTLATQIEAQAADIQSQVDDTTGTPAGKPA
jgi:hypothetical protein